MKPPQQLVGVHVRISVSYFDDIYAGCTYRNTSSPKSLSKLGPSVVGGWRLAVAGVRRRSAPSKPTSFVINEHGCTTLKRLGTLSMWKGIRTCQSATFLFEQVYKLKVPVSKATGNERLMLVVCPTAVRLGFGRLSKHNNISTLLSSLVCSGAKWHQSFYLESLECLTDVS